MDGLLAMWSICAGSGVPSSPLSRIGTGSTMTLTSVKQLQKMNEQRNFSDVSLV